MSVFFDKPFGILRRLSRFSATEVGMTHPEQPSFLKMADNGDIYIMADESLGIIISKSKGCILLVASTVKFVTNEEDGLKWNMSSFNPNAKTFADPALVEPKGDQDLYSSMREYLD